MADVRASSAILQTVQQGSSGGSLRATSTILQMVTTAGAGRVRSTFGTLQLVTSTIAPRIRSTSNSLQVVRTGATGARYAALSEALQVVYTIGIQDVPRRRAWTFTLDGHDFYCLDLAERGTLVYDLTTQQWTKFDTTGYSGHFNFKSGIYWKTGRRIVGGDILTGRVWEMVTDSFLDDGWRPVMYEARGALFVKGVNQIRQYALRMIGSAGRTADDIAPVLHMQFSDDQAQTWSSQYVITLTTDTKQRIEWRSLGAFAAPGRIFRLYDTGGIKFIGWVEADVD